MLNDQRACSSATIHHQAEQDQDDEIRDIHALTPPHVPPINSGRRREAAWENTSHRSSSISMASDGASSENFTTMSREFNALVIAGAEIGNGNSNFNNDNNERGINNLGRIGEEGDLGELEETNPLAIVADINPMGPVSSPRGEIRDRALNSASIVSGEREISVQRVKKEEVESKISAWQNAKVSKINNRFKREDAVIGGWENEQILKATSCMKKVERKLEEKRARALEKMQNEVAKAHRKAEERRASAEAKRGTKVARVFEIANLMRAVGRAPAKRSFF